MKGAGKEVFYDTISWRSWSERIDAIIVNLHNHMKSCVVVAFILAQMALKMNDDKMLHLIATKYGSFV